MRKMKPFKKYAEGGDTGVREGRNRNIDDETRQRALDRMEARRVMESMKSDAPKPAAKPMAKPAAKPAPKVTDTGDESARMARRAPAPAKAEPKTGMTAVAEKREKAGNIYTRSRGQSGLPPPIDTTPKIDTTDVRRQARLKEEAQARAASRPKPVVSNDADTADEDREKMTPAQRSAARGAALKRFLGFKSGGSIRGCGVARKGLTKGKMR